jgi:hypothetical protein
MQNLEMIIIIINYKIMKGRLLEGVDSGEGGGGKERVLRGSAYSKYITYI